MGDYWKIVGSCPELGRGSNEVGLYREATCIKSHACMNELAKNFSIQSWALWLFESKCFSSLRYFQVAPKMRWTEGDVWVLDVPIREGNHTFKAVLRRADGAYIGEKGDKPRVLEVKPGMSKDSTINVELDAQLPW